MVKDRKKLLLDIGNSRIKWALSGASPGKVSAFAYGREQPDQIAQKLWGDMEKPTALTYASVAGAELTNGVIGWCEERWGLKSQGLVSSACCLGVKNAYEQPERLGVDRWVALIAAYHRVGGAVMVLDCGTAISLDAVTETGVHLGGVIFPGPELMWTHFSNEPLPGTRPGFCPNPHYLEKIRNRQLLVAC